MKKLTLSLVVFGFLVIAGCNKSSDPGSSQSASACPNLTVADAEKVTIFPASHPLNADLSTAAKDSRSDAIIQFITDSNPGIKADFGSGLYDGAPIGIPFIVVCNDQPKIPIVFEDYGDESDPGPYPSPLNAPIEGNGVGDSHVIALDKDNGMLYELFHAHVSGKSWYASSGAVFNLNKEEYRTKGWTSGDAAGLPIFPLLVRYDEVASGVIDHAIRFTLPKEKIYRGYVRPGNHLVTGGNVNASIPTPMGMRLRLRQDFDISTYSATNQIILKAMKKYGIILADIGGSFFISGAPNEHWNNDDLQKLKNVKASNFEVMQMGTIETK